MTLVADILSSNAVQLALTFSFGASLCLLPVRKVVLGVGVMFAVGVFISFFFLVGEVYIYSDSYRRAFLIFGDSITTVLGFLFLYSIAAKRNSIALLAISAVFMSGGKASIILLLLMLCIFMIFQRRWYERHAETVRIGSLFLLGVSVYFILQYLSISLMNTSAFTFARGNIIQGVEIVRQISLTNRTTQRAPGGSGADDYRLPNFGTACASTSSCLQTQFAGPLSQRYYTGLAGLWMTLQGGFPGSLYPGTSDEFADLMVTADPWSMNERYGLTWDDWERMGGVQSSYLAFSSGYGPLALLMLFLIFFTIAYLAWQNLRAGESDTSAAFSIFFIVTVVANWTQSWLMSGSFILMLLGLCACRILVAWALRRNMFSARRKFLEHLAV